MTGGGSGIGFSIAESFLKYGAEVFIASRKAERLEEAVGQLKEFGKVSSFQLDIREPDQVAAVCKEIKDLPSGIDILVNNAGGQFPSPAELISTKGWNAVINTNLNGTWYLTREVAKTFFFPEKSGKIVNIIANIYRGFAGMAHTGAARAGVENLTKSLAVEWAKHDIQINAIAPGVIKSSGLDQYPEELLKGISEKIPAKRLGTTQEVADLVLFLASPQASFITGETVYIDGGQRLWGDIWQI